ncbi:MAG TPA: cupin domain-containing protein [Polyangia bacterium]|nr:cupin domain-containing protein [Polyangia bacterium]
MEVLASWLAPDDCAWFLDTHLGATPFAAAGRARGALPLLDWSKLDDLLGRDDDMDVLTVARGRMIAAPRPRSAADVRDLMGRGASVVVRASERHDAGLRELADSFGRVLPGEVHVQLYATPAGTNSYGWHYDFEDVFIAQTAGVKDYYFRANTVARESRLGERLDFEAVRRETTPLLASRLVAADWLYLPARWWHLVTCAEDALSISVGVMPPSALRDAVRLPAGWSGRGWADPEPGTSAR